MTVKKALIIFFFFIPELVVSEDKLLQCGDYIYKIRLPIIGFDKAYIKIDNNWKKFKNFEVTEEFYLIEDATNTQKKCAVKECKTNIYISKLLTGDSHLEYKINAATNECKIDAFDINKFLIQEEKYDCYSRKKGFSLEKGYCKIIDKEKV